MSRQPIRVLIAEDQAAFRNLIRAVLEKEDGIEVVGEAADGEQAIAMTTEFAPHVVLMDVRMPKLTGIDAARVLNEMHPNTKVLMLTVSDEQSDLLDAIRAGASGYVLKDTDAIDVAEAVKQVHGGEAILSNAVAPRLWAELADSMRRDDYRALRPLLTNREVNVLQLLARGLTSSEIALRLKVTEGAVNNHILNVLKKLHVHERMQLVVDTVREDLAPEPE